MIFIVNRADIVRRGELLHYALRGGFAMSVPTPFFLGRTPTQAFWMRVVVCVDVVMILAGMTYLAAFASSAGISLFALIAAIAVGIFVSDFISGVVHWGMDTWFSEQSLGRAVLVAREHHSHPQHILRYRFLDHASLGSAPGAVLIPPAMLATIAFGIGPWTYGLMIVWTILAVCMLLGTSFHNLGHHYSRFRPIRALQKLGVLITPAYHGVHHRPPHLIRYCVITGWANPVCDRFGVWRGLERLITRLTGYQPRVDDIAWETGWKARILVGAASPAGL